MKRVLAAVACGGCLVAPSRASSPGWRGAGATTGLGGTWPNVPQSVSPNEPKREQDTHHSLDGVTAPGMGYGGSNAAPGEGHNYNMPGVGGIAHGAAGHPGQHASDPTAAAGGFCAPPGYEPQEQHQHQEMYDPPSVPQQSHWAGPYGAPPQHRQQPQQPQHQQQHQPPYRQDRYPQGQHPPQPQVRSFGDGGDALRLGTKWRTIVSRVKDAVRPGQSSDYYGPPGGHHREHGGSWAGDGGGSGGGAGGGYIPPGSSWMGSAKQSDGYASPPDGYGQQAPQPNPYNAHGHEQRGPPAEHNPFAAQQQQPLGRYSSEENSANSYTSQGQHHVPPSTNYLDPRGSSPRSAQQRGVGDVETDAWQASPPWTGSVQPPSDSYNGNTPSGSEGPGAARGVPGGTGYPNYSVAQDSGMGSGVASLVGTQDGQGTTLGESPFPGAQPSDASYATSVGSGWTVTGSESTPVLPQEDQRQPEDPATTHGPEKTTAVDVTVTGSSGQGGEQFSAPGDTTSAHAWTRPRDGGTDVSAAAVPPVEAGVAAEAHPLLSPDGHGGQSMSDASLKAERSPPASAAVTDRATSVITQQSYGRSGGAFADTMPSSADHGMEEVDWGKGAEEDEEEEEDGTGREDESGETVVVTGGDERLEQERDEEALIRELELMDRIGSGELLNTGDGASGSSPPPLERRQEQVMVFQGREGDWDRKHEAGGVEEAPFDETTIIDEAVEHRLDVLFDSILDDDDEVDVDSIGDAEFNPEVDNMIDDVASVSASAVARLASTAIGGTPGMEGGLALERAVTPREADGGQGGEIDKAQRRRHSEALAEFPGGGESPRVVEPAVRVHEEPLVDEEGFAATEAVEASPEVGAETEKETGADIAKSMWGKTRRWESLPPHAVLVSEPEEGIESESDQTGEDDEDMVDVTVPLDPIELPPSAATDEIWNDQHLQDQLDAYWEQSRRNGAFLGGDSGGEGGDVPTTSSSGVQHLSAYGGHLQPTYGPGDWVGKGSAIVPEPLPGVVDGIARAGWVGPRLFQGNQAPINIYGNVHVHLPGGQDGEQQTSKSPELSARERYYSQGETSWSGSERGGPQ